MRSAPPSAEASPVEAGSSAPVWRDEFLEDFAENPPSPPPVSHVSAFPAPPSHVTSSKGKMKEFMDYDYFEDLGPEGTGPSAPPFDYGPEIKCEEACASAPPLTEEAHLLPGAILPSAPPLSADDESIKLPEACDMIPSAPPCETEQTADVSFASQNDDQNSPSVGEASHNRRDNDRESVENASPSSPTILPTYYP
jgi:hypothetical protein